jgi:nitrate reductase delta subunit
MSRLAARPAAPGSPSPPPSPSPQGSSPAGFASPQAFSGATDQTLKLVSVLLQYPTAAMFAGIDTLTDAARSASPRRAREHLGAFLSWFAGTPQQQVAAHYVETFDLRRRCALYLTYYRYGDTRNRGMALVEFKTAYRTAGFTPCEDELPDYLPMVLDFAALCDRGRRLLHGHRTDLELLRRALQDTGSPYAELLSAVCAQLPSLGHRELRQVLAAWESGPPTEQVGLEPFAPPEYLAGYPAAGHRPDEELLP